MISLWQGTTPFMWAQFDLLTKLKLVFRRAFTKQTKSFWVWKVSNHCKPSNLALWCFNYFLSSLLVANVLNLKKDVIQNRILQRDIIMKVTFKDFFSNGEYIWVYIYIYIYKNLKSLKLRGFLLVWKSPYHKASSTPCQVNLLSNNETHHNSLHNCIQLIYFFFSF